MVLYSVSSQEIVGINNNMKIQIHEKDIKKIYNGLRSSAKKRGIPFTLTMEEIQQISIPISCPIFHTALEYHRGVACDNSISFDRIDSSKGYDITNLHVISNRANKLKSDATIIELQQLAEYFTISD